MGSVALLGGAAVSAALLALGRRAGTAALLGGAALIALAFLAGGALRQTSGADAALALALLGLLAAARPGLRWGGLALLGAAGLLGLLAGGLALPAAALAGREPVAALVALALPVVAAAASLLPGNARGIGLAAGLLVAGLGVAISAGVPAAGFWLSAGALSGFGLGVAGLAAAGAAGATGATEAARRGGFGIALGFLVLALLARPAGLAWIGLAGTAAVAAGGRGAARRNVLLFAPALGLGLGLFGMALGGAAGRVFVVLGLGGLGALPLIAPWRAGGGGPVCALVGSLLPFAALLRLHALAPGGGADLAGFGLAGLLACAALAQASRTAAARLGALQAAMNALALFAFGLGDPLAAAGGLLILGTTALLGLGLAARFGADRPAPGSLIGLARAALVGLPPFAPFTGLLLIAAAAVARAPLLVLPLGLGLFLAGAALADWPGGPTSGGRGPARLLLGAALVLALLGGVCLPLAGSAWLAAAGAAR